ncbi:MAG: hypothetical protein IKP10_01105 [Clostridia bacterium]|nr:hypothetical protein [Clostridia bacterium]
MKYVRRFMSWLASRLLAVTLVLALAVTVFYYAMNMANIQVVLKDGMNTRVRVRMGMTEMSEMNKFFELAYIAPEERQLSPDYDGYDIRGIDHRLDMGYAWLWPWSDQVTVEVTERVPLIDGRAKTSRAEALVAMGGSEALNPPPWKPSRYRATLRLVKAGDSKYWKITDLIRIGSLDE